MGKRRFWAHIEGDAKNNPATGSSDVLLSHTRGWDLGIKVVAHAGQHGKDTFDIYVTGGTNSTRERLALTVRETAEGTIVVENEDTHDILNKHLKKVGGAYV